MAERTNDYWRWSVPAKCWIDDVLLPVTPQVVGVSQNPKNESGSTADGRPVTRPKLMDAQTFTLEFIIPYADCPLCFPYEWHARKYFTDHFWNFEEEKAYHLVSIWYPTREAFTFRAMLDKWDYTQSAANGSAWEFTLTFTEAYPRRNIESTYVLENPYIRTGERNYMRVS